MVDASVDCSIWEAARATSASPTFFKPIIISSPGAETGYLDGGLGYNNPTELLIEEAVRLFPADRSVDCVVSIGTAQGGAERYQKPDNLRLMPIEIIKAMASITTTTTSATDRTASRFQALPDIYFRLEVGQGLQNISLDSQTGLDELQAHTKNYMGARDIQRCLKALTKLRANSVAVHGCTIRSLGNVPVSIISSEEN